MSKSRNICQVKGCRNFGSYCRIHIGFVVPEVKEVSKVSDNQKEILKKYKPIRAKYLREHPLCEANHIVEIPGCQKVSVEIHHKKGKVGEVDYLNPDFYLAVCRNCHNVIEASPAFSRIHGLSLSRHSKAS